MCIGRELKLRDRYLIERSLKRGLSHKEIADFLGVSRQCIDYEVKKGTVEQMDSQLRQFFVYKADYADKVSRERKSRTGSKCKYTSDSDILHSIERMIKDGYSPYATIVKLGIEDRISEKTIYNYVRKKHFVSLKYYNLPYMKRYRRSNKRVGKISIPYEKSIEQREKTILSRTQFGHWEMDTVYSSKADCACLLVLTERKARFNFSLPLANRTQMAVERALRRAEISMGSNTFKEIFKTITVDNGMEFRDYEGLEKTAYSVGRKRTHVYYAHPYSSCERGSNEVQNKMIRRFIPKGDDISLYSKDDIRKISSWINTYPRRAFGGRSSADMVREEFSLGNISQKAFTSLMVLSGVV